MLELFMKSTMPADTIERELARGESLSIINIVDYLIEEACKRRVSDIHIDPTRNTVRVRMRIDGVLHDACTLPNTISSEIIARIKVLAHLRTDEHQMPQDGRFRYQLSNNDEDALDVRVSIAPTYHGENAVLRLLSNSMQEFTLQSLGFCTTDIQRIASAMRKQGGMMLVTGPTGSGKTTTLYTLMRMLNSSDVSIVSIEDPIEYSVDGVEQLQVNPRVGLNFANGLRTILRQDPNIIMVGEIRDIETAAISINSALTGHLLLSTLHTNDAATTIPRLLDMKAESYLVASTLRLSIGQRLVRKLCESCKQKDSISRDEWKYIARGEIKKIIDRRCPVYRKKGCDQCDGSGFSGRICVAECLLVDNDIRGAIMRRASARELHDIAILNGMTSMRQDGLRKVADGVTTLEEVLRVVHE